MNNDVRHFNGNQQSKDMESNIGFNSEANLTVELKSINEANVQITFNDVWIGIRVLNSIPPFEIANE